MTGQRKRPGTGLSVGVVTIFVVAIGAALASGSLIDRPAATPSIPTPGSTASTGHSAPTTAAATTPTVASSVAPTAGGSGTTVVDPTLLSVLPATVGGAALVEDPDTERQDATDPSNGADLAAVAVAIAVDTDTSDLAVASVVRVRPGVFSDAYFADWRTTFDTGACSQAGGVSGISSSTIGGHETFSATCAGGLVTYHVHLADRDLIVSISSLGANGFGRLIVEGLR